MEEENRGLFQRLSGFETRHPAAASPLPAFDFSVSDEQDAAFLVSVMHCSDCDSSAFWILQTQVGARPRGSSKGVLEKKKEAK